VIFLVRRLYSRRQRFAVPRQGGGGLQLQRDLRLLWRQIGYEQLSFWRNPAAAFFTFALPLVFLFIFVSVFGNQKFGNFGGGLLRDVKGSQYYVSSILGYGVVAACFSNLSITLCFRRDQGILKRVRGTPIPPWVYLSGAVGSSVVVSFLLSAICVGAGVGIYGVPFPHAFAALVVAIVVGAASFCALGLAVTTLIPNAEAAPPVANIVMLVLLFISGTYFPVASNSGLGRVAAVFPVQHFILAVRAPIVPELHQGAWQGRHLLVMGLWGVGGLLFAVRRFRWEARPG
jgi:ABC-2 type transport system permease protein